MNEIQWYKAYYKQDPPLYGLLNRHSEEDIMDKMLVQAQTIGRDGEFEKLYTIFHDYLEFAHFLFTIELKYRDFYETIRNGMQKPRFDIDIDLTGAKGPSGSVDINLIRNLLIDSILKVFEKNGLKINLAKDLLIFTSHGPEKKSMHIVIDNYCHTDCKEAYAFYEEVMKDIPAIYHSPIIDNSVYKSFQQFRLPGCAKLKTNRYKTLNEKWFYYDQEINYQYKGKIYNEKNKYIQQLEAGCITYTSNCQILPRFIVVDVEKEYAISKSLKAEYQEYAVDEDDIKDIESALFI